MRNRNRDVDIHSWSQPDSYGEGKIMFFSTPEAAAAWTSMGINDHERIVRLVAALEEAEVNVMEVAGAISTHKSRVKRWLLDLDADVEFLPHSAKVTVAGVAFYFQSEFPPLFWDSFCTFLSLMMGTEEKDVPAEAQVVISDMHVDEGSFFNCWNLMLIYHKSKSTAVHEIGKGRTDAFDKFFSLDQTEAGHWILTVDVCDETPGLERKQYGPLSGSLFSQISYIQARIAESLCWDGEESPRMLTPLAKAGPAVFIRERLEEYGPVPVSGPAIRVPGALGVGSLGKKDPIITMIVEVGSTLNVLHVVMGELGYRLGMLMKHDQLGTVSIYGYDAWKQTQLSFPNVEFALCARLDLHPTYSDSCREEIWGQVVPCVFYYGSENFQLDRAILGSRSWSPAFLERLWSTLGPVSKKWTDHVFRMMTDQQVASMITSTIAYSEALLLKHVNVWAFDTENIPNDGTDRVTDWHAIEVNSGRFVRGDSYDSLTVFAREEFHRSLFLVKGADRELGLFRRMGLVPEPRAQGKLWVGVLDVGPLCKKWQKEGKHHRARDGAEQVLYRVAQALFALDEQPIIRGMMDDILRQSVEAMQSMPRRNGILVYQTPMYRTCNNFFPQAIAGPECWHNAGDPMPLRTCLSPDVPIIRKATLCQCEERGDARAGRGPASLAAWHQPHYDVVVKPSRIVVKYLSLDKKFGVYSQLSKKRIDRCRLWSGESFGPLGTTTRSLGGGVDPHPILPGS